MQVAMQQLLRRTKIEIAPFLDSIGIAEVPDAIFKAVVASVLLGLTIAAMWGVVGFWLLFSDILTEDIIEKSLVFHGSAFFLCSLPNAIGGFLAAKFAPRSELLHGIVAGTALLVIAVFSELMPDEDPFALSDAVYLLLVIPLSAGGAYVAKSLH